MKKYSIFFAFLFLVSLSSCREDELATTTPETEEETVVDTETYPDWTDETHSKSADPNYDIVFKQNTVLRFDIKINATNWATMQSDIAANLGATSGGPGGGGPGGIGPGGIGSVVTTSDYTPVWVPCSVLFEGKEWYQVGVRYKGNSSLSSAYQSGNKKLSLKLDFDEFEDSYPALKNQRFYGFKQLNLNNNFDDASLMREKISADMFRQFGLVSAQVTFCEVYVDNGTGSQYYGVYTLVEEVDNTVIDTQLGDDSGNIYKPDGDAASFASGTYDEGEYEKKNNEDQADYSDVKALYDIINSSERTTDTEAWKTNLEAVLDVDGFLKWLAANTTLQNWDTYGRMTHNYYLYNNAGKLTWIPWDNNESLQEGKQGGALSFGFTEVGTDWPLIKYIIAQDEYNQIYKTYLRKFIDEVFVPATLTETYSSYYTLLKDYAYAEQSGYTYLQSSASFDQAVSTLKTHVQSRTDAVNAFLK